MMKRLTILMLLLLSTNVWAEWTSVGVAAGGEFTSYVDFKSIRKNDNMVKMWYLFDYKNAQQGYHANDKFLSTIYRDEFDCEEETSSQLGISVNSGKMGRGKVIYTDSIKREPKQILPDSIMQIIFKFACGTK